MFVTVGKRICRLLSRRSGIGALLSSGVKSSHHPLLTAGLRQHLTQLLEQYHALQAKANSLGNVAGEQQHRQLYQQLSSLDPVVSLIKQLETKEKEIKELEQLCGEDGMLRTLALEEEQACQKQLQNIQRALMCALVPRDTADSHSAILEVRAGAGGKEASLFAYEIFQMYRNFAAYKHWQFEVLEEDTSTSSGYKHASASVSGSEVFGVLKHESGVHRVQRVPITEGSGRVHTSTMSVAILPEPSEIDVEVNPSDLRVETHRSSGPGGQSVNTTDSAVRLTHIPTGIVVHIQDERSQHKNRSKALKILRARLYHLKRSDALRAERQDRKQQIGSGDRHEKVRTYNFLQDRVTDHRIGVTLHGVERFMEGEAELAGLVEQLQAQEETRAISTLLSTHQK